MHWNFCCQKDKEMKIIVEDSSFIVNVFHDNDPFHKEAVELMKQIIARRNQARIIIPSIAFFESIFKLIQIGLPRDEVEKKLWDFLYLEQVFNIGLVETSAFRLMKKFPTFRLKTFKTSDYLIVSTALAFDACVLTYDKGMRRELGKVYPKIFYCDPNDNEFRDDYQKFLDELSN